MTRATGRLHAVNVLFAYRNGPRRETAIDKRPRSGPIQVRGNGLAGDDQCDRRYHGGVDRAVYAYAREDLDWWAAELDREISPGWFGENLTTAGIDVTGARIGECWLIGRQGLGPLLEVRLPRIPCGNFTGRMRERAWVRRFSEHGAPGAYLKVLRPGKVRAGDPIAIEKRPDHGITVGDVFSRTDPEIFERLLDSGLDLAPDMLSLAQRRTRHSVS